MPYKIKFQTDKYHFRLLLSKETKEYDGKGIKEKKNYHISQLNENKEIMLPCMLQIPVVRKSEISELKMSSSRTGRANQKKSNAHISAAILLSRT